MKKVLKNAHLSFEEFYTVLKDIQRQINGRPLQIDGGADIDCLPITPHDLMFSRKLCNLPAPRLKKSDFQLNSVFFKKRIRYIERLNKSFWERFRHMYLTELTQFHFRARKRATAGVAPKVGELCLMRNEKTSPNEWRMCKILSLHPGPDGIVRRVLVKPSSHLSVGDGRIPNTYRAPNMLVPLQISMANVTDICQFECLPSSSHVRK